MIRLTVFHNWLRFRLILPADVINVVKSILVVSNWMSINLLTTNISMRHRENEIMFLFISDNNTNWLLYTEQIPLTYNHKTESIKSFSFLFLLLLMLFNVTSANYLLSKVLLIGGIFVVKSFDIVQHNSWTHKNRSWWHLADMRKQVKAGISMGNKKRK